MFEVFASFVYRNRRRVLLVALLGIAVAGVFGLGVAKRPQVQMSRLRPGFRAIPLEAQELRRRPDADADQQR